MSLSDLQRQIWSALLADAAIVELFAQLERVYLLGGAEGVYSEVALDLQAFLVLNTRNSGGEQGRHLVGCALYGASLGGKYPLINQDL